MKKVATASLHTSGNMLKNSLCPPKSQMLNVISVLRSVIVFSMKFTPDAHESKQCQAVVNLLAQHVLKVVVCLHSCVLAVSTTGRTARHKRCSFLACANFAILTCKRQQLDRNALQQILVNQDEAHFTSCNAMLLLPSVIMYSSSNLFSTYLTISVVLPTCASPTMPTCCTV
jgi:hypothetical protein